VSGDIIATIRKAAIAPDFQIAERLFGPVTEKVYGDMDSPLSPELIQRLLLRQSSSSVADTINITGISSPSALAVVRLMTNSNLVDCCTGRSAGLAPLRMVPV
jgi:hypothetical protein